MKRKSGRGIVAGAFLFTMLLFGADTALAVETGSLPAMAEQTDEVQILDELQNTDEVQDTEQSGEAKEEENEAGNEEENKEEKNEEVKEEKTPRFTKKVTLEPGSSYDPELDAYGEPAELEMTSEQPAIVKVTKDGKLKALKCGNTVVWVTVTKGEKTSTIKIKVSVKYDRFLQKLENGQLLKKGKQKQLAFSNLEADAQVEYRSSKPKVAEVSEEGVVTAKKSGTTKLTVIVWQNEKKYVFYDKLHVYEGSAKLTQKQRENWFSDSGFVGNSLSVGLRMYFNSQKKGYLGNPVMMVRESYSFANDASATSKYRVTYNGTAYKASEAIKKSGVKKVFINMGMNDLWYSPEKVYEQYVAYLSDIRKKNPKVLIFIESTTPVAKGREKKILNNKNINTLNQLMKDYCAAQKDIYYIDISSCLKDEAGYLRADYASDGYVHLTMSAYAAWMKVVCSYTDKLMIAEWKAQDALLTAEESLEITDYEKAAALVDALEKSTVKTQLKTELKTIKKKLQESAKQPVKAENTDNTERTDNAENTENAENTNGTGNTDDTENAESIENTVNDGNTGNTENIGNVENAENTGSTENAGDTETSQKTEEMELSKVRKLTVTSQSNTSLKLSWEKQEAAGYYRIYRSTKENGSYKEIGGTTKTTYTDTACKKNTAYYYKIKAGISKTNTTCDSEYSQVVSGQTKNIADKVVFAGDSIMEGIVSYDQLKNIDSPGKKYVVAYKGLGTLSFQIKPAFDGETAVDRVISYKPDRLYLMLGMNEMSYRSQKDMLKNYTEILEAIQEESPKTEIVLIAVSPVTKSVVQKQRNYADIAEWNASLKKLAKKYNAYYFDCTEQLADADGYLKYDGGDGIHWNLKGYQVFVEQLTEFEKKRNG